MTGANWTDAAEIVRRLAKLWQDGTILRSRVDGTMPFPLRIPLRRPRGADLAANFTATRAWIHDLESRQRSPGTPGYRLEWHEIRHRQLGRNRVPAAAILDDEADALALLGRAADMAEFDRIAARTLAAFPSLRIFLAAKPLTVLLHAPEWDSILAVLHWFHSHPRPDLYLRQLDVPGVDTKFIETRRGLLAELLDAVLPGGAVDTTVAGATNFERRYGLKTKPSLLRFRPLVPLPMFAGCTDLSIPHQDFAALDPPAGRVFVTENEVNFLAFPPVPDSLVVFGQGYALERLLEIGWIDRRRLYYWGDIDTHGFAILDRLRGRFPHARSLLMDRATLLAHRALWGVEPVPSAAHPSRLTGEESALFQDLIGDRFGINVRLEQERISFHWLQRALQQIQ